MNLANVTCVPTDDEELNKAIAATDDKIAGLDFEAVFAAYDGDDPATFRREVEKFARFPDWVRLGMLLAGATWDSTDPARKCPHNPDVSQPVQAAAWLPNYVVCEQCTHLLGESRRCDCCGAEPDADQQPLTYVFTYGRFTYRLNTCDGCRLPDMTH